MALERAVLPASWKAGEVPCGPCLGVRPNRAFRGASWTSCYARELQECLVERSLPVGRDGIAPAGPPLPTRGEVHSVRGVIVFQELWPQVKTGLPLPPTVVWGPPTSPRQAQRVRLHLLSLQADRSEGRFCGLPCRTAKSTIQQRSPNCEDTVFSPPILWQL